MVLCSPQQRIVTSLKKEKCLLLWKPKDYTVFKNVHSKTLTGHSIHSAPSHPISERSILKLFSSKPSYPKRHIVYIFHFSLSVSCPAFLMLLYLTVLTTRRKTQLYLTLVRGLPRETNMFMNRRQNRQLIVANKSFENLALVRYWETTVTNKNCIHKPIKIRRK